MKKTIFILTLLLPFGLLCAQSNVDQQGDFNFVKVSQEGEKNLSDVHTWGDGNAFSFVVQKGVGVNVSDVDQDEDGNSVNVTQELFSLTRLLDINLSIIDQDGKENSAIVHQIGEGANNIVNAILKQHTDNW